MMKVDDPEIDIAQTPKRLDGRLALLMKIPKTFNHSIPNTSTEVSNILSDMQTCVLGGKDVQSLYH